MRRPTPGLLCPPISALVLPPPSPPRAAPHNNNNMVYIIANIYKLFASGIRSLCNDTEKTSLAAALRMTSSTNRSHQFFFGDLGGLGSNLFWRYGAPFFCPLSFLVCTASTLLGSAELRSLLSFQFMWKLRHNFVVLSKSSRLHAVHTCSQQSRSARP